MRIHDAARRPPDWSDIIRPGQFVAFAKDTTSGGPTDPDGHAFADASQATCVIFDSFADARTFCERAVQSSPRGPALRFDIFDAAGRTQPPLLTVLHPSQAGRVESHPTALRRRRLVAWILVAAGIALIVYAYGQRDGGEVILPAFVGINMLIAAGRLLWFNLALRETERARRDRVDKIDVR